MDRRLSGRDDEKTETVDRTARYARRWGVGQTPDHILLAKRYEPNPVQRMSGPSFPCQDPRGASGKNEVGEQNARFKGRRCLRVDQSLLGRPLISLKRAAWVFALWSLPGRCLDQLLRGSRSGKAVLVDAQFGLLPLGEGYGRLPSGKFKLDLGVWWSPPV